MPRRRRDDGTTVSIDVGDGRGPIDVTDGMQRLKQHDQLRSLLDRIVRLEEEKAATAGDIKDIYAEAKSAGYAPKALKVLVKRELESPEKRAERIAIEQEVELMTAALGVFVGTPLGKSAMDRAGRGTERHS